MGQAPTLPPELCRHVSSLARTLIAAGRCWALYPPDHPAVRGSLDRLRASIEEAGAGRPMSFGVMPETLVVDGLPLTGRDAANVCEAAGWLHDRDVLEIGFAPDVSVDALQRLLGLLSDDPRIVRQRGGPAKVWADEGDAAIVIEQIDFSQVLKDREVTDPARRKDDIWRSIVKSVLERRRSADEAVLARLLAISGDVVAITELARDLIAPHHTADGSPMLTSQAAAVLAAYRHLTGIVEVMAPDRRAEVMQNIASATANLSPQVVMQMLAAHGEGSGPGAEEGNATVVRGIVDAFDDAKVAQLLATTLAIEGQASQRLATVFDTIAPDEERKRRVLSLTRSLLGETDFGRQNQFQTLWSSMEELLLTYNERPFVSANYRIALDDVSARADEMAGRELPEDLIALVGTLEQDNVRRLSVTLLIDLLALEPDRERAVEVARDVASLAEDLLLAGDYDSATAVVCALADHAADPGAVAYEGSRTALDALVSTLAFHEATELLGEMTAQEAAAFSELCRRIGPPAADALARLLDVDELTTARERATAVIRGYGIRAVNRLGPLLDAGTPAGRRNGAELLGEIGAPDAVPLLQPLLRAQQHDVLAAAVRALASIKDPAAARAIHTVLRVATGAQRGAVVEVLVGMRDARVVPVLVRILEESEPFGADHAVVLETLAALGQVGDDEAVPTLSRVMRRKKLFGRKKVVAVKQGALDALASIRTPAAISAIDEAAVSGDRLLRRLARTRAHV